MVMHGCAGNDAQVFLDQGGRRIVMKFGYSSPSGVLLVEVSASKNVGDRTREEIRRHRWLTWK